MVAVSNPRSRMRTKGFAPGRQSRSKLIVVVIASLLGTVLVIPSVEAISAPQAVVGDAGAWASFGEAGQFHDIDRKHCPRFWGCGWLDGTNINTPPSGATYANRGMQCGTHRYRHQGQNGLVADDQLTRNC